MKEWDRRVSERHGFESTAADCLAFKYMRDVSAAVVLRRGEGRGGGLALRVLVVGNRKHCCSTPSNNSPQSALLNP